MQQINFKGDLISKNNDGQDIKNNTIMFFIVEEAKETTLNFSQGPMKVRIYFILIKCQYKMNQYNILNVKCLTHD